MRRNYHIGQFPQGTVCRERLLGKNIERRACNYVGALGVNERGLLNHLSARQVYE
jgi:hypothetical protein